MSSCIFINTLEPKTLELLLKVTQGHPVYYILISSYHLGDKPTGRHELMLTFLHFSSVFEMYFNFQYI